jgi:hypothetical protein
MSNYIYLDSQSTVPQHHPEVADTTPQTVSVTPQDCSDFARIPFSSLLYYILVGDDALPA